MAKFAIVRADGSADQVDGLSVQDVADQYGWPGNGTIEEWSDGKHGKAANVFASPAEQYDAWKKVAEKEGQFGKAKKAEDTASTDSTEKKDGK